MNTDAYIVEKKNTSGYWDMFGDKKYPTLKEAQQYLEDFVAASEQDFKLGCAESAYNKNAFRIVKVRV